MVPIAIAAAIGSINGLISETFLAVVNSTVFWTVCSVLGLMSCVIFNITQKSKPNPYAGIPHVVIIILVLFMVFGLLALFSVIANPVIMFLAFSYPVISSVILLVLLVASVWWLIIWAVERSSMAIAPVSRDNCSGYIRFVRNRLLS